MPDAACADVHGHLGGVCGPGYLSVGHLHAHVGRSQVGQPCLRGCALREQERRASRVGAHGGPHGRGRLGDIVQQHARDNGRGEADSQAIELFDGGSELLQLLLLGRGGALLWAEAVVAELGPPQRLNTHFELPPAVLLVGEQVVAVLALDVVGGGGSGVCDGCGGGIDVDDKKNYTVNFFATVESTNATLRDNINGN